MIAGHVYVVHTALARPPKDKISLCICSAANLFFWVNTDPARHGVGQLPLQVSEHRVLSRDCFLDCSRVTTFPKHELNGAQDRGVISPELAQRIVTLLLQNPPKTLAKRHVDLAIANIRHLI